LRIYRRTLSTRKVNATKGAASVPDEVFHRSQGVQLCNTQAYQCTPAFFADSYFLNMFSSEVIAERAQVPTTARVICERHTISVVPVTRVTMSHRRQSFSFYIVGYNRDVYLKDYYPSRYCWGLCPCLEWLKLWCFKVVHVFIYIYLYVLFCLFWIITETWFLVWGFCRLCLL
jgi:hypothetical protein